jgi:predicted HicB family RNase H-like nuclease
MKRIINGVTYNTDTSTMIARAEEIEPGWKDGTGGDRDVLTLYQTRLGAFFIHRDTVSLRRGIRGEWEEDEHHTFDAMTRAEAHKWVLGHDGVELLSDVFEEPPEAAEETSPGATLYIRVPSSLKDRIEAAAASDKLSVNAWAIRCMEGCVAYQQKDVPDATKRNRMTRASVLLHSLGYQRMPDGSFKAPSENSAS